MFFAQRVIAVIGDGVEVEVEAVAPGDPGPECGIAPVTHQCGQRPCVDPAAVFAQRGPLGKGVEPGKQRQPLVEHLGHGLGRTPDAPQLEGQQGAKGRCRGDHVAARHRVPEHHAVEADGLENGQEQEQSTEGGSQPPRRQIQAPDIGNLCGVGTDDVGLQMDGTPGQSGPTGPAQDGRDG